MTEENKNNGIEIEEIEESVAILKKRKEFLQQKLESFKFKLGWLALAIFCGAIFAYAFASLSDEGHYRDTFATILDRRLSYIILGMFIGAFLYAYFIVFLRTSFRSNLRRIEFKLIQLGAEELQEKIEENFFTSLVQINFKYLDKYYLQTQEQADKSFRVATAASIVGLIIIATGVIMMFMGKTDPAYITTATGVISEFIAAVFFYLYNRTILKMSHYHQKLVITQNISLALKMSENMDTDNKAKVQEMIIDRLTFDINKYLSNSE